MIIRRQSEKLHNEIPKGIYKDEPRATGGMAISPTCAYIATVGRHQ